MSTVLARYSCPVVPRLGPVHAPLSSAHGVGQFSPTKFSVSFPVAQVSPFRRASVEIAVGHDENTLPVMARANRFRSDKERVLDRETQT